MAFAITDDHTRQEHVYENLSYNRDPSIIRRDLTKMNVAATDRCAVFVGAQAYAEAGGNIIRDLFTEDRGGFFEDPALLDRLAVEKLERIAAEVREAEGWKWTAAYLDFPHAHGMRRVYPRSVELSEEDAAAHDAAQDELERLTAEWEDADIDLPAEVDTRLAELEAEIERIDAKRHAYDPDDITRGGAFVVVGHSGDVRIERGFIRVEDEALEPEAETAEDGETVIDGVRVNADGEILDGEDGEGDDLPETEPEEEAGDAGKPLPDSLIRDLTAHRTLGLRLALGEQPDMALIAVIHTLVAQTFYRGGSTAHCLEISPTSNYLSAHADGIEDTAAAKMLDDRHAGWAADMPRDVADLWGFVAGLDHARLMALLAHCASLTVNAVKLPWETSKRRAHETADKLATAVTLDMTAHWTPTVRSYFGRITKAHIVAAVREALGDEAAERIADKKKVEMAEAAEQLLAGTGWLPPALRTERPAWFDQQAEAFSPASVEPAPTQEVHDDHFAIAAE